MRLHELKTGRLIGASVVCVLLLADVRGPATIAFRRFAAELGVLFQIVDDILDVTGTVEALGKPQGSDERHGKRTYVSEFGNRSRTRALAGASPTRLPDRAVRRSPKLAPVAVGAWRVSSTGAPGADRPTSSSKIADFIYTPHISEP